ncbi:MAG: hypothetical protein ACK44E_08875 [Anaerolineales bacterium]
MSSFVGGAISGQSCEFGVWGFESFTGGRESGRVEVEPLFPTYRKN